MIKRLFFSVFVVYTFPLLSTRDDTIFTPHATWRRALLIAFCDDVLRPEDVLLVVLSAIPWTFSCPLKAEQTVARRLQWHPALFVTICPEAAAAIDIQRRSLATSLNK